MHRILWRIPIPFTGGWPVFAYGWMMMMGFLAALVLALRLAKREGVDSEVMWDLWMWSLVFGVIGARGLFILQNWKEFEARSPLAMLYIWEGGLAFYGGLAGAAIADLVYLRRKRILVLKVMDIIAPSLALGFAFGRIGCFLNGCCFGKLSGLPWPFAVRFPRGPESFPSPAFLHHVNYHELEPLSSHSLAVHPVQLYASLAALGIFLVLLWFLRRRRHVGEVTLLFLVLYPASRFLLEFLRGDNLPTFTGLTVPQNMSAVTFIVALVLFVRLRYKGSLLRRA
jgi:phosphatidylglycerol:prolipoprotein diacylglycerol transferase